MATDFISLIVCTVGRTDPLARLLASLEAQRNAAFEVIVVDQNDGPLIEPVLRTARLLQDVRHIRAQKGLSRARNAGLREARGAIVGFPDDDCWYDADVTEKVRQFFLQADVGVLTGRTLDAQGKQAVSTHLRESSLISRDNVFLAGNSNTLFTRRTVAEDVGGFDEALGVGSGTPFQSGEETDFILHCIEKGYCAFYDREFIVHHDQTNGDETAQRARISGYAQGYGRVLRVHGYGLGYLMVRVTRATLRGAICLAARDINGARRRYDWAAGAVRGYFAPTQEAEPFNPRALARMAHGGPGS